MRNDVAFGLSAVIVVIVVVVAVAAAAAGVRSFEGGCSLAALWSIKGFPQW